MGIEDEIRSYRVQGYSPQEIIRRFNFKRSTVYKVYSEQRQGATVVTRASWSAQGIEFDRGLDSRYLPGEDITVAFSIQNDSPADLYVVRAGIQPEWLESRLGSGQSEWLTEDGSFMLRPNQHKAFRVTFRVPDHLPLGEYDLRFGMEGQFLFPQLGALPRANIASYYPEWTDPIAIRVQDPLRCRIFVSHSTQNMSLVRQLDNYLDCCGISCVIAEDVREPGRDLHEKFYAHIDQCVFFLALLTREAVTSQAVIDEVNYALDNKRPGIYLVEEGVDIALPTEWAGKFSRDWPIEELVGTILTAVQRIEQGYGTAKFPSAAVVAALVAFFAGLAAGKSRSKG